MSPLKQPSTQMKSGWPFMKQLCTEQSTPWAQVGSVMH